MKQTIRTTIASRFFKAVDDQVRLFIPRRGTNLFCEVAGDGVPVVLLHGLTASRQSWHKAQVPGKLEDCRVIIPDARGHGESDKPHEPAAYGAHLIDDILAILDFLKTPTAHLVGYSMGSMTALRLAVDHPCRIRSLTLSGYGWMDRRDRAKRSMRAAINLREGQGLSTFFEQDMQAGKSSGFRLREEAMEALLKRNDPLALAACLESLEQLEFPAERLNDIDTPVLIANGRQDPYNKTTDELTRRLPNSQKITLRGNHLNAMFDPVFAETIREFIAEVEKRHD